MTRKGRLPPTRSPGRARLAADTSTEQLRELDDLLRAHGARAKPAPPGALNVWLTPFRECGLLLVLDGSRMVIHDQRQQPIDDFPPVDLQGGPATVAARILAFLEEWYDRIFAEIPDPTTQNLACSVARGVTYEKAGEPYGLTAAEVGARIRQLKRWIGRTQPPRSSHQEDLATAPSAAPPLVTDMPKTASAHEAGRDDEEFEQLLERSSLGTPGARELRRRTSPAHVETVRRLAATSTDLPTPSSIRAVAVRRLATQLLRTLRASARSPSIRQLVATVGVEESRLHPVLKDEAVPPWPNVEAFIRACGGDPETSREQWAAAAGAMHDPGHLAEIGDDSLEDLESIDDQRKSKYEQTLEAPTNRENIQVESVGIEAVRLGEGLRLPDRLVPSRSPAETPDPPAVYRTSREELHGGEIAIVPVVVWLLGHYSVEKVREWSTGKRPAGEDDGGD